MCSVVVLRRSPDYRQPHPSQNRPSPTIFDLVAAEFPQCPEHVKTCSLFPSSDPLLFAFSLCPGVLPPFVCFTAGHLHCSPVTPRCSLSSLCCRRSRAHLSSPRAPLLRHFHRYPKLLLCRRCHCRRNRASLSKSPPPKESPSRRQVVGSDPGGEEGRIDELQLLHRTNFTSFHRRRHSLHQIGKKRWHLWGRRSRQRQRSVREERWAVVAFPGGGEVGDGNVLWGRRGGRRQHSVGEKRGSRVEAT